MIFGFALVLVPPVFAQEVFEEEIVPDGPRGRYSIEQGEIFALRVISGEVLERDIDRDENRWFYEYTIRTPDESVYQVDINAQNGDLANIYVDQLSPDPVIPLLLIPADTVENIALSNIQRKTSSSLKVRVQSSVLTTFNSKLAYTIELKQSARFYRVVVDALNGDVLDSRRMR